MNFPPALKLGELIRLLEQRLRIHGDQDLRFDFEYCAPDHLSSYRGFYEDLAVGWLPNDSARPARLATTSSFLEALRSAVGSKFDGWKGGTYIMTNESSVWVANPGDVGGTVITGIADEDALTVLNTEYQG